MSLEPLMHVSCVSEKWPPCHLRPVYTSHELAIVSNWLFVRSVRDESQFESSVYTPEDSEAQSIVHSFVFTTVFMVTGSRGITTRCIGLGPVVVESPKAKAAPEGARAPEVPAEVPGSSPAEAEPETSSSLSSP